jgi:hypothetical protein
LLHCKIKERVLSVHRNFGSVIPGRAPREPGIHNHDWGLWIPGLRQEAHPGMTAVGIVIASEAKQSSTRAE